MKKSLVFVLFFPLAFLFFCGGKRTTRPTEPEYKFTINGVVSLVLGGLAIADILLDLPMVG